MMPAASLRFDLGKSNLAHLAPCSFSIYPPALHMAKQEVTRRLWRFCLHFPGAALTVGKALYAGGNLGLGFARTGLVASTLTVRRHCFRLPICPSPTSNDVMIPLETRSKSGSDSSAVATPYRSGPVLQRCGLGSEGQVAAQPHGPRVLRPIGEATNQSLVSNLIKHPFASP